MNKLFTWGYYTNSPEGNLEKHTVFAIAENEHEAKVAVINIYQRSLNWPNIERALGENAVVSNNGDCFICVTGPSILP